MCAVRFGQKSDGQGKVKSSRRSTFKAYNKHRELKIHPLDCHYKYQERLKALAYGDVRMEATTRALELKRHGCEYLKDWSLETSWKLHRIWLDKMEIAKNVTLTSDIEDKLPRMIRSTYTLWREGFDLKSRLSKATFYRHRKLLREYGIDIDVPPSKETHGRRVIPLLEVVQARPTNVDLGEALFAKIIREG